MVDSRGIEPLTQILQVSNATLEHGRPIPRVFRDMHVSNELRVEPLLYQTELPSPRG